MKHLSKQLGAGFAVMMLVIVGMIALPHDRYIRWQAVKTEAFARLGWIYERVHFDETPIDIAFIGTSHTLNGLDTPLIQRQLREAGVRLKDGQCPHLVNLAVPSYGRDLHWLIARELLENKPVKHLVVEVFENETRQAHALYAHVAEVEDFWEAPILINMKYFPNWARLPYRQLLLGMKSLSPSMFGLKKEFDFSDYDGSDVDNTRLVNVGGQALSPLRDRVMDKALLLKISKQNADKKDLHMLGAWATRFEYAVPHHYLGKILNLADKKGVPVTFLYLPQFGMPPRPFEEDIYVGRGDWLYVNDLLQNTDYWFDEAHLNAAGAQAISQRVAADLRKKIEADSAAFSRDGSLSVMPRGGHSSCQSTVHPARLTIRPFLKPLAQGRH
ncbi:MAG TPA: hypothetical protein DCY07_04780 [Rhodospirillaceae bacterium]|nr:hypothetical protein [Rhodospirillaceae bacterium]